MSYLILTGAFACGMAFHNTAARYFYSLGRERVFPAVLGKTHPVYKSPYVASFTQSVIAAIIVVLFWIFCRRRRSDGAGLCGMVYGLLAVMGTMLILFAQAVVSIAIIVYFRTHHPEDHHWLSTLRGTGGLLRRADLRHLSADLADGVPRRRTGVRRTGWSGSIWSCWRSGSSARST